MLIHLDSSAISSALGDDEGSDRSLRCIERLIERHEDGHHILSVTPEDAQRFRSSQAHERLSEHHRNTFLDIQARFADTAYLRGELWRHLVLGIGPRFDGQVDERAVLVNLHRFYALDSSGRAVLLCENATDVDFYLAIGRLAVHHRRWSRKLRLHCDPRSGGGSQLGRELTRIAQEGRIVFAIVDSDRKHPGGAQGGTARAALDAVRYLPAFQHAHVLSTTREAENLVTLDGYQTAFEHLGGRGPLLEKVERLREAALTAPEHQHTDLKRGIRLFQISEKRKDRPEQPMWLGVAQRRGRTECKQPKPCEGEEEQRRCACWVVEPLGEKILEQVVEWLEKALPTAPDEASRLLLRSEGSEAAEIAAKVIAWGCAYPAQLGA